MTEDQLYARIGRLTTDLENLNDAYNQLLTMVNAVAVGEIAPKQVHVDLTNRSWAVAPTETSPGQTDIDPILCRENIQTKIPADENKSDPEEELHL